MWNLKRFFFLALLSFFFLSYSSPARAQVNWADLGIRLNPNIARLVDLIPSSDAWNE